MSANLAVSSTTTRQETRPFLRSDLLLLLTALLWGFAFVAQRVGMESAPTSSTARASRWGLCRWCLSS